MNDTDDAHDKCANCGLGIERHNVNRSMRCDTQAWSNWYVFKKPAQPRDADLSVEIETAWENYGITMFRAPTPKELREAFNYAFTAGYQSRTVEDEKPKVCICDHDIIHNSECSAHGRTI